MSEDFKSKGYHSKSEMRRIEAMKEHERDKLREENAALKEKLAIAVEGLRAMKAADPLGIDPDEDNYLRLMEIDKLINKTLKRVKGGE